MVHSRAIDTAALNTMKRNHALVLFAAILLCLGAASYPTTKLDGYSIKVLEYDGCEYVVSEYSVGVASNFSHSFTHKGNCKYCADRKK